jgi:ABC-2 type transport system ATP-binding protein
MSMIAVAGLSKLYGSKPAVRSLDFELARGQILGLLGLNGAGKTTVLKMLACQLLPTSGRATVDGRDVVSESVEVRRRIGYLPDEPPLYDEMRVDSFLRFAAGLHGLAVDQAGRRIEEVLGLLDLRPARDQVIGTLSQGFRQRVGIAQAIVHEPPVVILDEPFTGLDPMQISEMRSIVSNLRGRHTVLLSSHNLPEVSRICDRFLLLSEGSMVAHGTEEELARKLGHGLALTLELRAPESAVRSFLECRAEVSRLKIAETEPGVLRIELQLLEDVREELARELVEAGFGLLALSPRQHELDAIFAGLAGAEVSAR